MTEPLIVTKAGGQQVNFSRKKLIQSLRRSGASEAQIEDILTSIEPRLYQGISTKKIYRWAFDQLKQRSKHLAARYKLKNAIMELGPNGFIFEIFVARIFQELGYNTIVGQIEQGRCVTHEIDVIADNESEHILIECKYHSLAGKDSDVKVPLYIRSRFEDVEFEWKKRANLKQKKLGCKVVTNTRFSPDATTYAKCVGLDLISWDAPTNGGIKDLIDSYQLYPITCLTSITRKEKDELLNAGFILCRELLSDKRKLNELGLSTHRSTVLQDEIDKLSNLV